MWGRGLERNNNLTGMVQKQEFAMETDRDHQRFKEILEQGSVLESKCFQKSVSKWKESYQIESKKGLRHVD